MHHNPKVYICLCCNKAHIEGLVQDCCNSSVLAMELLQSCTKPSIFIQPYVHFHLEPLLLTYNDIQSFTWDIITVKPVI